MGDDLVRIQFEMTKEKVRDLDHLMHLTSMRSRRELFDNALTFFEWGVSEIMRGNLVAAVDEKRGFYQPMVMPAFVAARRSIRPRSAKLRQPDRTASVLPKRARRNQLPLSPSAGRSDEEQFEPHTVEGAPKPKHKEA